MRNFQWEEYRCPDAECKMLHYAYVDQDNKELVAEVCGEALGKWDVFAKGQPQRRVFLTADAGKRWVESLDVESFEERPPLNIAETLQAAMATALQMQSTNQSVMLEQFRAILREELHTVAGKVCP